MATGGRVVSGTLLQLDTSMDNRRERQKACNQSGIFVEVADIDHPVWQIKFSDGNMMRRYWEIFNIWKGRSSPKARPSRVCQGGSDFLAVVAQIGGRRTAPFMLTRNL